MVLETWSLLSSHSFFFDNLRNDGHTLTFKLHSDKGLEIKYHDDYFYDNILLMAPGAVLKDTLSQAELVDFVDKGHNLMVFADDSSGMTYRRLANQFGIDFEQTGFLLRDHENERSKLYSQDGEIVFSKHVFEGLFDIREDGKHAYDVFSELKAEVAFRGIGHVVDPKNDFVFPILRAASTSFSTRPDYSEISRVSGGHLNLVSGY